MSSPDWDSGTTHDVGAVTWGNGTSGAAGVVSAANSLIGTKANDGVGGGSVVATTDGHYVVLSPNWDKGVLTNAGAVSLGNGFAGTRGTVGDGNSVVGTVVFRGTNLFSTYDPIHARLLVSESASNRVSLFAYPTPLKARLNNRLFTFPNAYELILGAAIGGSEYGAYARALEGASPALALVDVATGGLLSTNFSVTTGGGSLLLMNNSPGANFELRVASAAGVWGGRYDVALYPVVRPGRLLSGGLTAEDPGSTNRAGAVGSGRWRYDDYLMRGAASGDRVSMVVESSSFAPLIEVRLLSDESVQDYRDGSSYTLTVQGNAQSPRDYLIRVTSSVSGALGDYTLRVERVQAAPEIWSFSPGSGVPGTKVMVRGTNFLDGQNPVVTGVEFGGAAANWDDPIASMAAHEFETTVPASAVSGPIRVFTAGAVGTSTNAFIVLSPVGNIRREPGGGFSFAVSNAVAGIQNVVERAMNLTPPTVWTPAITNTGGVGVWWYTNATPGGGPQQFFRVRRP